MSKTYPRPPMFTNDLGHGVQGTPEGVAEDAAKAERRARLAAQIKRMDERAAARDKDRKSEMGYD